MNKLFKLLLVVLFLPPLLAGVSFSSPLDLIADANGNIWGRMDYGYGIGSGNGLSHLQFDIDQGIRFKHALWVEPYVTFVKWQQTGVTNTNYWAYGLRNKTWLQPFVFGVEEESYVWSSAVPDQHLYTAYVSVYTDWNLRGGKKDE